MVTPNSFNPKITSKEDPEREDKSSAAFRTPPQGDRNFREVLDREARGSSQEKEEQLANAKKVPGALNYGPGKAKKAGESSDLPSPFALAGKKDAQGKLKAMDSAGYSQSVADDDEVEAPDADKGDVSEVIAQGETVAKTRKGDARLESLGKEEMVSRDVPVPADKMDAPKGKKMASKSNPEESTTQTTTPFSMFKETSKKEKGFSFSQEHHSDLSYIAPLNAPEVTGPVAEAKPTARAPYIQELVNQMVEQLKVITYGDKSETQITLKHPPLFAGAQLVVTEFDSKKVQSNIAYDNVQPKLDVAFHNLTVEAKQLLDLHQNREHLKSALAEKGYGVYISTTTTEVQRPTIHEGTFTQGDDRSRREGEGERRHGREEEDEQTT